MSSGRAYNLLQAARAGEEFSTYIEIEDDSDVDMERLDYESDEESDDEEDRCSRAKEHGNFYGESKVIGTLWAAIQTELLTYRRLTEEDPWISENIIMRAILDGLNHGGLFDIPLITENMMSPYCKCGRFLEVTDEASAFVDEVCTHYPGILRIWVSGRGLCTL
jgi:hypothetical protein